MVTFVIVINVLISIVCLYIAWRIVKLRRRIAKFADRIIAAERRTYAVLHKAPTGILKGQSGAQQMQARYQQLKNRLQQVQQVLVLLDVGQKIWLGRLRKPNRAGEVEGLGREKRKRPQLENQ